MKQFKKIHCTALILIIFSLTNSEGFLENKRRDLQSDSTREDKTDFNERTDSNRIQQADIRNRIRHSDILSRNLDESQRYFERTLRQSENRRNNDIRDTRNLRTYDSRESFNLRRSESNTERVNRQEDATNNNRGSQERFVHDRDNSRSNSREFSRNMRINLLRNARSLQIRDSRRYLQRISSRYDQNNRQERNQLERATSRIETRLRVGDSSVSRKPNDIISLSRQILDKRQNRITSTRSERSTRNERNVEDDVHRTIAVRNNDKIRDITRDNLKYHRRVRSENIRRIARESNMINRLARDSLQRENTDGNNSLNNRERAIRYNQRESRVDDSLSAILNRRSESSRTSREARTIRFSRNTVSRDFINHLTQLSERRSSERAQDLSLSREIPDSRLSQMRFETRLLGNRRQRLENTPNEIKIRTERDQIQPQRSNNRFDDSRRLINERDSRIRQEIRRLRNTVNRLEVSRLDVSRNIASRRTRIEREFENIRNRDSVLSLDRLERLDKSRRLSSERNSDTRQEFGQIRDDVRRFVSVDLKMNGNENLRRTRSERISQDRKIDSTHELDESQRKTTEREINVSRRDTARNLNLDTTQARQIRERDNTQTIRSDATRNIRSLSYSPEFIREKEAIERVTRDFNLQTRQETKSNSNYLMNTIQVLLVSFLLAQMYIGSSKANKFSFANIIGTQKKLKSF